MTKKVIIALLAASAVTFSAKAVNLELALCIDNSGSISVSDFNLQKNGYVNALTTYLPTDGSVAIGVWDFESVDHLVFNELVISSAADKTALINAIAGISYIGGNTALGDSITDAYRRLVQSDIVGARKVIDVSTDGLGNVGVDQVTARNSALAGGIDQINGLLIGAGASGTFVGGTDSFSIAVSSFTDFNNAIQKKLQTEIQGVPDAGSSLALLGFGLVIVAGVKRRIA